MSHPFTLSEIVEWYKSKQKMLENSDVIVSEIIERTTHLPAAGAEFVAGNAIGRINGWVSGLFDFEAIRVSDQKDLGFKHVAVRSLAELEAPYTEFIQQLRGA